MAKRSSPPSGGILRVQAFDAKHQPLDIDAPDDWDDDSLIYFIPASAALRFMHATRRGLLLDGSDRLIAYWVVVGPPDAPPRVHVTRYGRGCVATINTIPLHTATPGMLPKLPRERGVDCNCGLCKQHRIVRRMYPNTNNRTRKASA